MIKVNIQLFGGRGAKGSIATLGGAGGVETVDYNDWGKNVYESKTFTNDEGYQETEYYIEDEDRAEYEDYVEPVTKKALFKMIDDMRMDDGTYGDADTAIYLAYEDGSFVDLAELNGKRYKKTGVIGISYQDSEGEAVWGGENHTTREGRVEFRPYRVRHYDESSGDFVEGETNSYLGYRATAIWKERVKTTFPYDEKTGTYKRKREVIRRSTKKTFTY